MKKFFNESYSIFQLTIEIQLAKIFKKNFTFNKSGSYIDFFK